MTVTDQLDATARDAPVPAASAKKSILQFELTKKKVPRKDLMHFSPPAGGLHQGRASRSSTLSTSSRRRWATSTFRAVLEDIVDATSRRLDLRRRRAQRTRQAFPTFYLGILRSAELTGQPRHRPRSSSPDYIERDLEARRKVTSALIYPAVIMADVGGRRRHPGRSFVLPKFEMFFDGLDAELPLPTRMLLGISGFSPTYWYVLGRLARRSCVVLVAGLRTRQEDEASARPRRCCELPGARRPRAARRPGALLPGSSAR